LAATDQTTLQGRAGTKALRIIDAHAADRAALVAQVAELTREWDAAREERDFFDRERQNVVESLSATESEVTRLTEALAAAERRCEALTSGHIHYQRRAEAAESRLAAANALLERCQKAVSPVSLLGRDLDAHIAAQSSTAPARDEEPQRG
jgi:chromosome segregation ATPase